MVSASFFSTSTSWFAASPGSDLSLSFSQELDRKTIPRLKSWAGLYRGTEVGALFRSREHLGLQLTSIEEHYQHLQVVKCCLLQSSQDECIRTLYAQRKEKVCEFTARWSGPKELAQLEPVADHALRFAIVLVWVPTRRTRTSPTPLWWNAVIRLRLPSPLNVKKNICATLPASCDKVCGPTGTTSSPLIFLGQT